MRQVLEGICYLHKNRVLHLDVKVRCRCGVGSGQRACECPVGARHWGVLPAALSSRVLPCVPQPENLLVWDGVQGEKQVRICDFGNAQELTPGEPQYCQYGTPEFVAPEVVNQTPVSGVTDIW